MRSNTAQQSISELETENFESFTDTALGDDVIDLRKTIDRLESVLLEAAQNCDPKRLSYATRTIRYCEDADGGVAADNKNYDARYLHCARQSGLASTLFNPTIRRRAASAGRMLWSRSAASAWTRVHFLRSEARSLI